MQQLKQVKFPLEPSILTDLEHCVDDYIHTCKVEKCGVTPEGFKKQVLKAIGNSLDPRLPQAHCWLVLDDSGKVAGFSLTHFDVMVDDRLTYWMSDGWVREDLRNSHYVKEWVKEIRNFGVVSGASHILFPCSRAARAWQMFLGRKFKKYVTILKEDL